MKQRRVRTISLRNRIITKDNEGVPTTTYGAAFEVHGEVWPASGRLQSEMYGDRINGIMNMRIREPYTIVQDGNVRAFMVDESIIHEGDGVCVNTDNQPDYKIISIRPYKPLRLEIEKL